MGQAKLRGTREQRVAEGIAKRQAREAELEAERARRWRAMTPAQRRRQLEVASMMAFAAGSLLDLRPTPTENEDGKC